jgi:hypothetical protein
MNLGEMKQRIQLRAEDVADEDEVVSVNIKSAPGLPPWSCEVGWTKPDRSARWTGYTGPIEHLEQEVLLQIFAREKPAAT